MPLLVHCPNRCQIRVPANRMGKVIRCIDCHTPIRIPEIESPLLRTGNWVECRAKRAIKKTEITAAADFPEQTPAPNATQNATNDSTNVPSNPAIDSPADECLPLDFPQRTARLLRAKPWRTVEPLTSVDPEDVLTPIELDDAPSSTEPPLDQSNTDDDLELANGHAKETDIRQPQELSLISRLLWFVNPFAKRPPRSA